MARSRAGVTATALLLGMVLLTGCRDIFGTTRRTLEVQHHKAQCSKLFFTMCLLVRDVGTTDFVFMSAPEGFEYEWGFTYEIVVTENEIDNPPADGSSIRRRLVSVQARELAAAGTPFEITVWHLDGAVTEVSAGVFSIHNDRSFVCPTQLPCDDIRQAIQQGKVLRYQFQHPASNSLPLVLEGWTELAGP